MWSAIWPVLVTFAFGGLGWFVANFFAKPFLDFRTLRSQVHEEIIFTANVGKMTARREAEHEKAVDSLRRLGAKIEAMDESHWFISKLGFDLATAGRNLIGLPMR
jgi:hypothetical protein